MRLFKNVYACIGMLPGLLCTNSTALYSQNRVVDICIYGGTSAGVIAAYTAAKAGKSVLLVEPGKHLGGMSSGGLGHTDIGNKYVITGLALDFYRRVGRHYGNFEQWDFEPKVAESVFNQYIQEGKVPVLLSNRITGLAKNHNRITTITLEDPARHVNTTVTAKVFMDCSYEGDLMARAGVSYVVGREANSTYGETFNGVQLRRGHQLPDSISPYRVAGDTTSGLLWGVSNSSPAANGTGDHKVQAYNYRICLTNVPENRISITKPEGYNVACYELLARMLKQYPWKNFREGFIWSRMPNGKTDINNKGGFSTDMIGANWRYPDADYATRDSIIRAHEVYTKGLLYFLGNDQRVPVAIRTEISKWGYPKDEYPDNNHWSHQLYIREARRMVGELVMTQQHCIGAEKITDGVGMAAYAMDSHNCDRQIVGGFVKNEGNVEEAGFSPYPVSYRSIIPKQTEADNLLVPVCLSASHIAYGSIRMEPVFMVLGQSAALAAVMAVNQRKPVQQVDIAVLQRMLKQNPVMNGTVPETIIDNEDSTAVTIKGSWKKQKRGGFGPNFLVSQYPHTGSSVTFTPAVTTAGTYQLYVYFPKIDSVASRMQVHVSDGKKATVNTVYSSQLKVEGQSSGAWLLLGSYQLPKGRKASIKIAAGSTDGYTIADAVLLAPIK